MKISKERKEEIKYLFKEYNFIIVDTGGYPTISISLYDDAERDIFTLIKILTTISQIPEADKDFYTDYETGYYGGVEDFKIEVQLSRKNKITPIATI